VEDAKAVWGHEEADSAGDGASEMSRKHLLGERGEGAARQLDDEKLGEGGQLVDLIKYSRYVERDSGASSGEVR
jgi:hypothetical protein